MLYRNSSARRSGLRASIAALALMAAGSTYAQIVSIELPPDPCVDIVFNPSPVETVDLPPPSGAGDLNAGIRIYTDPAQPAPLRSSALVLIVNGNGFNQSDYVSYATYLARQGFTVAVARRPSGVAYDVDDFVLDSLALVFAAQNLANNTKVALIGHSVGGATVLNAAVRNKTINAGFNVDAVVTLAPSINASTANLSRTHADAFLAIFGSQDQDVEGLGNEASDAFAAYDRSDHEGSSTCHGNGICFATPTIDKRMLFIHGADHASLVNATKPCLFGACEFPQQAFISKADQYCITRGYTNAFLRRHLRGETVYQGMLEGRYRPPSIAGIVSNAVDAQLNPIGSPLRLSLQQSPSLRSVIENFLDEAWSLSQQSPQVQLQLLQPEQFIGGSSNVRHVSHVLAVGWTSKPAWQYLGFNVPAGRRNVSNFERVSIRVGQLHHGSAATANPSNVATSIMLGLGDANSTSWRWTHNYAAIPANDFRPGNDYTHSVMNTVAIPLSAFTTDKTDVRTVVLAFPPNTKGTLMIDNLEWFKD